jgi:hypothetical protein
MLSPAVHDGYDHTFLETHVRDVESERRRYQPIDWPPIEVILHIFTILVLDDEDDEDSNNNGVDNQRDECKDNANNNSEPYHHPLAPPPIVLSHVCRKWRAIALSNPILWSRVRHATSINRRALPAFLDRSANAPLDITFYSIDDRQLSYHQGIYNSAMDFLDLITLHSRRWKSIKFRSLTSGPIQTLVSTLADTTRKFPYLATLDIAHLQSRHGSRPIISAPDVLNSPRLDPAASTLRHLRLEKVPLYMFGTLLSNVTHLELSQPLYKWYGHRIERSFYLSGLLDFLTTLPLLKDLTLIDTTHGLRLVSFAPYDADEPVQLLHLKRIEWSCPYPTAIHQFLSSVHAPSLDKLDLILDDQPTRKPVRMANYIAPATHYDISRTDLLTLHSLKDLSIHYADQDTLAAVSRYMNFPSLHTLELTNIQNYQQKPLKQIGKMDPRRLEFPRIDFVFRDPRLPQLTRLTISHFEVEVESASTMLVYMPSLTALYLDACTRLPALLACLSRGRGEGAVSIRRAALCPRLETLSFWSCADLELAGLLDVVKARNAVHDTKNTEISARKIKRLRGRGPPAEDTAHVTFIRLKRCPLITEDDALSLMNHGVNDVLWNE